MRRNHESKSPFHITSLPERVRNLILVARPFFFVNLSFKKEITILPSLRRNVPRLALSSPPTAALVVARLDS